MDFLSIRSIRVDGLMDANDRQNEHACPESWYLSFGFKLIALCSDHDRVGHSRDLVLPLRMCWCLYQTTSACVELILDLESVRNSILDLTLNLVLNK